MNDNQMYAIVWALVATVAIVIVLTFGGNYWYAAQTERKAFEAGYCQVINVNNSGPGFYHWEKCPAAK